MRAVFGAGVVLVLLLALAIRLTRHVGVVPVASAVRVTYQSFQNYWDTGLAESVVAAGSGTRTFVLHPPREATFVITNSSSSYVRIWAPQRIEFKNPPQTIEVVPAGQGVLPPHGALQMPVPLTGREQGTWRLLVPTSDYTLVVKADAWLGSEPITGFLNRRLQMHPQWIATEWLLELPARPARPPAGHELDRTREVITGAK
jgi:hypothetical protein